MPYDLRPSIIEDFKSNLGSNPLFVNDLDGNIFDGYVLTDGNETYFTEYGHILPSNRNIPENLKLSDIEKLVQDGVLKRELFAAKTMDVRLPRPMVDALNALNDSDTHFKIGFLTSRKMEEALIIFKNSGVKNPEKCTIVADSGASLYVKEIRFDTRPLNDEERATLDNIDTLSDRIKTGIKEIITQEGLDAESCPDIYVEQKGIAANIHYRSILEHYQENGEELEGSILAKRINSFLNDTLSDYLKTSPVKDNFKLVPGPCTWEVAINNCNKGHGLEAIVQNAIYDGAYLSSVVFSGDDVSKAGKGPGTDYYAMIRRDELSAQFGIPFYNIHTHHPESGLNGTAPNQNADPKNLPKQYQQPTIDLVVRTPRELTTLILGIEKFSCDFTPEVYLPSSPDKAPVLAQ